MGSPSPASRWGLVLVALALFGVLAGTLWYEGKAKSVLAKVRSDSDAVKTAFLLSQNGARERFFELLNSEPLRLLAATYWEGDEHVTGNVAYLKLPDNLQAFPRLDAFLTKVEARQSATNSLLLGLVVAVIAMLTFTVGWTEFHNQKERERQAFQNSLHQQLLDAVERERAVMAWDLHDSVVQKLGFLKQQVSELNPQDSPVAMLQEIVSEAIRDARSLSQTLSPVGRVDSALNERLDDLFSEFRRWSSIRLETITTGLSEIEPATPLADHLFRMVQELLANARKHSQATRVRLAVQYLPPLVRLKYQDDGHGIPPEEASIQPSLKSLEFRTKLLQGTLTFSPSFGGGLSIVIEVPHGPTARS